MITNLNNLTLRDAFALTLLGAVVFVIAFNKKLIFKKKDVPEDDFMHWL